MIRHTVRGSGGLTRSLREVVAIASRFVTRMAAVSGDGSRPLVPCAVCRLSVAPHARFDTPPDLRAATWAANQHGCIRADQLAACGLDRAAVARRVRKGWLHRLHTGVYAVGYSSDTLHAQFMAAVLAGGGDTYLSHWASCSLAQLVRWDDRLIELTVVGSAERRRAGIRFHRARTLDRRDVTRIHGIPCTTPARAILEIAPQVSDQRLKRLIRKAQVEKRANTRQIAAVLRRAKGHRATRRIANIIAGGPAPTASGHEDVVLDLIIQAGFEAPTVNEPLRVTSTAYTPDLRWAAPRLILEIDSSPWHDGPLAQGLDAERQAKLEAAGERVLRTTREQAILHPQQLVARLTAAGAPRATQQRPTLTPSHDQHEPTEERQPHRG
jgi:hypothetical protein